MPRTAALKPSDAKGVVKLGIFFKPESQSKEGK
jgi:hypothetical protein